MADLKFSILFAIFCFVATALAVSMEFNERLSNRIEQTGEHRQKRSVVENVATLDDLVSAAEVPHLLSRAKRGLTAAQLEILRKLLAQGGNVTVGEAPSPCPPGAELRKRTCFKCPPGYFWVGATRKCQKCVVGTYSMRDATIGKCTPCPQGTTTADEGSANSTQCVEQCPLGHYSSNGLMYPINCKACPAGRYADRVGMKACTTCPARTTTSDTGAKAQSYCQAQCTAGFFSHNGLAPCKKCQLNTYQPSTGQRSCLKCASGKSTLAMGSKSSTQCIVINECDSNPCRNGGQCIDGTNKFICKCPPGWSGTMCEQNVDECASKPCWSGATCVDLVNDFRCTCPPGFEGKLCNLNINECKTNPCKNNGDCIDLNGDFECSCRAGWGGKTCAVDQPDCTPGICKNGGRCEDLTNGFVCRCASGFRGEQCTENIDDCANNNCLNGATCVDGVNSFSCRCAPGFRGNRCQENINECASNPCRNGGRCTDGINDYHCTCASYYGGKACTTKLTDCFNLAMTGNTIEDYFEYQPAAPIPTMNELTIKFSMKSGDTGLQAHYGTIISYAKPGKEGLFNIRAFPQQMLQINKKDWLTGVDASDNTWQNLCMTWRKSDGKWQVYRSRGYGAALRLEKDSTNTEALSRGDAIEGGGKFVIGQLYQGQGDEFNEGNIFQGDLSQINIWYKYDQCIRTTASPDLAWPNLVFNGRKVDRTNKNMVRTRVKLDRGC